MTHRVLTTMVLLAMALPAFAQQTGEQKPPPDLPPVTDEDRKAAFPPVDASHAVHGEGTQVFVLFDQLEWQGGEGSRALSWDARGWVGGDTHRLWFRTEGETDSDRLEAGRAQVFYGRAVARWWDLVAGLRQDVEPGAAQTWAAIGVQGLAPYWFEVEATAYIGGSGRTQFRLESEYELLLTNRLVLQPLVEVEMNGKADPARHMGAGLSSGEAGLRLRYEIKRELAPYVGVVWDRKFFGTAERAVARGEPRGDRRFVLGLRAWF